MLIKTKLLKKAFYVAVALLASNFTQGQELLKRKNIDALTPQELAAYEHAIQVLQDRSMKNPYDKEGYAWQAWVHNLTYISIPATAPRAITVNETYGDYYESIGKQTYTDGKPGYPGMCEHRKDLFFFWHRAEFYYFEKILQNTDPAGTIKDSRGNTGPATAKVTVPYWNFTKPASDPAGKRFPKAFVNKSSPLYRCGRARGIPDYQFTSKEKLQDIMNSRWAVFGGFPNSTGGSISGGYGRFEYEVHDDMHDLYCSGDMSNPATAAYDPIFYSFHAYVDFLFDEWIRLNNMEATGVTSTDTMTSLNFQLRGDNPSKYNLPAYDGKGTQPTMGTFAQYLDHKKLGYEYEVAPEDHYKPRSEPIAKLLDKGGKLIVFGKGSNSLQAVLTEKTSLAATDKEGVIENEGPLKGNALIRDGFFNFKTDVKGSYKVDVYFHPKNVKANIGDKAFRNKYLANSGNYWGMADDHMAQGKTGINIYVARELEDIRKSAPGTEWVITTNLTKL